MLRKYCFVAFWLITALPLSAARIMPESLQYLGAFRLPEGPEEYGWAYSGEALTFWENGDSGGEADGFPGSLFGTGHNWHTYVSEISIPQPVISPSKNSEDLNTAVQLQPFADIRAGLYDYLEIPRAGLEVLPAKGGQNTPKLYFCWAAHMGDGQQLPAHGYCEMNLANPQTRGTWAIGQLWNYRTTDYLFSVPQDWADAYVNGYSLITGRYRDGGQGSMGPALFAIAPWLEGNPPPADAVLDYLPLLNYCSVYENCASQLNQYHHADEWSGAAWIGKDTTESAVIFAGTKGIGECWYGLVDGTVWEAPYPVHLPDSLLETRGWWSERFEGQLMFYDTDDLKAVACGRMHSGEPQPYAVLPIDDVLFHVNAERQKHHVGAVTTDKQNGLIYLMEPLADEDKSIIHVWKVKQTVSSAEARTFPEGWQMLRNFPNPFNAETVIVYSIKNSGMIRLELWNNKGQKVKTCIHQWRAPGEYRYLLDANDLSAGLYCVRLTQKKAVAGKKIMLLK